MTESEGVGSGEASCLCFFTPRDVRGQCACACVCVRVRTCARTQINFNIAPRMTDQDVVPQRPEAQFNRVVQFNHSIFMSHLTTNLFYPLNLDYVQVRHAGY